jgi:hypothetical protein
VYQCSTSNWCVPSSPGSPIDTASSSRQFSARASAGSLTGVRHDTFWCSWARIDTRSRTDSDRKNRRASWYTGFDRPSSPGMNTLLEPRAARTIALASSTVCAIGASQYTCRPAARHPTTTCRCRCVGVETNTAATSGRSASIAR